MNSNQNRITLIGCGPGDVELITVKGLDAIKNADIVFYDALVNKELLEYTKKGVECIYVGKRFNNHRFKQDEINEMLVQAALAHSHVVRLKGGDSYVFGRGAEEVDFIERNGIRVEVIPGISSALAVPTNQGIPLTKRYVNESFWVITGTTSHGGVSEDLKYAAQSSATLVVLMGLRKLDQIIDGVRNYRSGLTPVAIIQNGTLPNERIWIGTIGDCSRQSTLLDVNDPGIIIIGDVVAEHPSFFEEEIQRVLEFTIA